jgi:hypothetical protein
MRFLADAKQRVVEQAAALFEMGDLFQQHFNIDDNTIADHAELIGMESARGNQVKDGFVTVHNQRMASIVAALESDDNIRIMGEEIDNLTFTFVSSLSANDCDVGHIPMLDFGFPILDFNRSTELTTRSKIQNLKSQIRLQFYLLG